MAGSLYSPFWPILFTGEAEYLKTKVFSKKNKRYSVLFILFYYIKYFERAKPSLFIYFFGSRGYEIAFRRPLFVVTRGGRLSRGLLRLA